MKHATIFKGGARAAIVLLALTILLLAGGCTAQQQGGQAQGENPGQDGPAGQTPGGQENLPAVLTILGEEVGRDADYLDLSACTPSDVADVAAAIREMPDLKRVDLMDAEDSSPLSLADVRTLKDAAPEAKFIYRFDLFGQRLSLSDTVIRYENVEIGNEGEALIRHALSVLDNCTYFLLDDCGLDNEVMAGIRDDFPDTKVVWRIHVADRSALTDDTVIRMTHGIKDHMVGPLQYCTDTVYMDMGHDDDLTDISFTAHMPHLECLILSGSMVTDLTPLQNCHALTWLELAYVEELADITPVAGLDSLKYLNISYTSIRDLAPLQETKLDRLCCIGNKISKDAIAHYEETHPDCMTSFEGTPWGYAWRYDDDGYTFFSYYARMREVFRYEGESPGGFKFPEYVPPENVPDEDGAA